jgi:hypothetical protein
MVGFENQNEYNPYCFSRNRAVFSGEKVENECLMGIIKNVNTIFFVE